ncbi:MAG: hypothetical protein R2764_08960 [Bacteroidales bacterium]
MKCRYEVVVKSNPIPMDFVGMNNSFGERVNQKEAMKKYGLTSKEIIKRVKKILKLFKVDVIK